MYSSHNSHEPAFSYSTQLNSCLRLLLRLRPPLRLRLRSAILSRCRTNRRNSQRLPFARFVPALPDDTTVLVPIPIVYSFHIHELLYSVLTSTCALLNLFASFCTCFSNHSLIFWLGLALLPLCTVRLLLILYTRTLPLAIRCVQCSQLPCALSLTHHCATRYESIKMPSRLLSAPVLRCLLTFERSSPSARREITSAIASDLQ